MTTKVVELRQKRMGLVDELRKFHEEKSAQTGGYSAEDTEEFNRRTAELGELDKTIEREEKLDELSRERDRRDLEQDRARSEGRMTAAETTALGLQAWARAHRGLDLTEDHERALEATGFNPRASEIDLNLLPTGELRALRDARFPPVEARQMVTTAGSAKGEHLVPEGFVPSWEISQLAISQLRRVATIMRTATGNAMPWPTTDDTSNTGELVTEGGAVATQDAATAAVTFNAYKYGSKICKISPELLADSAFNMAGELGRILGTRIARITNTHFTTGTGSSQPNGIVTASGLGTTSSSSSALQAAEIRAFPYTVDPAYNNNPGSGWMMHNYFVGQMRTLQDGAGTYMWSESSVVGQPPTLLGYPVYFNQAMQSSWATSAKIILFGDLSKYVIRDAGPIRLKHLVELYAANDLEAFVAFSRHDGDLLDAGTDPVKHLITAAA